MSTQDEKLLAEYAQNMANKAMQRKLRAGEAIDVSRFKRTPDGDYVIPPEVDIDNVDLCDALTEQWIWSAGRRRNDGVHLASTSTKFYQNPDFDCTWLR